MKHTYDNEQAARRAQLMNVMIVLGALLLMAIALYTGVTPV